MKQLFRHLGQSAWFKPVMKAGLTLLAFWFVFRGIDFARLGDMLRKQDHGLLLLAILLLFVQLAMGAFRWRLILNALSETPRHVLRYIPAFNIYYIGVFFNCCLPGTVGGDVIRVWLTKSNHVSTSLAIHSVIIDRLIALVALGVLVFLTLPVLGSIAGFNPMLVLPAFILATVAGVFLLRNLDRFIGRYQHFRIISWVMYFLDSLRLILKRRSASLQSLVIALCTHILYCLGAYALAQSFHININIIQCITLIPPVLLATTLPISIGGWGIREAGTIAMLGLIGIPQESALMLSIQLGLLIIVITLPASILWLLYRKQAPQAAGAVQ